MSHDDRIRSIEDALTDLLEHDAQATPATAAGLAAGARRRHSAYKRRRTVAGGAGAVVLAGVAAVSTPYVSGWAGGSGSASLIGASAPEVVPCADQGAYDLPAVHEGPSTPHMPVASEADGLSELLLLPGDVIDEFRTSQKSRLAYTWPSTPSPDSYLGADWTDLSTSQLAQKSSWQIMQTVAEVQAGTGATVYNSAVSRLTCTTPVHTVDVLTSRSGDVEWTGVRETVPTTVTDDLGKTLKPGPALTRWRLFAHRGDLVTEVTVNSWGDSAAVSSAEIPATWLDGLAQKIADRLDGRAPTAPLGLPG